MEKQVRNVVIVGGGTSGWMTAAALAKSMGKLINIELVESDDIGTVGVGEATIPQIKLFNQMLGIDEANFIKATQGTFKLGIEFSNWGKLGDSYLHGFGGIGIDVGMLHFYQYWLKNRDQVNNGSLWDYSLNSVAAQNNVFAPMPQVGETRLPGLTYAYHFDAHLYAKFLRQFAERHGVRRVEGKITDTQLCPKTGYIESITLANGQKLSGDLFIDCSGFKGLLIEQALNTGYEDWSHWLPCDRAVAVPSENTESLRPYTQSIAHQAGWQWRIPLQHRTGNGHVFASHFVSEQVATETLLQNLEGQPLAEPRVLKFTTGRRKKFWNKNCIAIGLASGFMEPLESTSIHLVQFAIAKLLDMFPNQGFSSTEINTFNEKLSFEFEHIRDFIILHYHLNQRDDSEFWRYCRHMSVPNSLTNKLTIFKESGRVHRTVDELFTELGWLQVMLGQNLSPQDFHPMANNLSADQINGLQSDIKAIISKAIKVLPSHSDFIRQHCQAPKNMQSNN